MDESRGSDDQHDLAGRAQVEGAAEDIGVERFPEPDDMGAEQGAAIGAARRDFLQGTE